MYKDLANATVQIISGSSSGSGFHFVKENIVITNHHVIEPSLISGDIPIYGQYEDGSICTLKIIDYSDKTEYDYAILEVTQTQNFNPFILNPKVLEKFERGTEIIFSGFPHGIPHLLTHKAIISAPVSKGFYIDGSVNGGNSGGPIIDAYDGNVIGIVTQRRYVGSVDLQHILQESRQLESHFLNLSKGGSVFIMGVDFKDFAMKMAKTNNIVSDVLTHNANSGIGIGFSICFVYKKLQELGIISE
ncbi:hypothetical protein GCM10007425_17790 [Lysinibacillus alkalisoli]|uniref:Trypsin-like peptidase domain-containing protein n=1 Tax=Lysinibacillus alkalisoli TaxID=1911548 RepID=A0A917G5F9_9BACI|nr:serine protease [Lysinibacillus alkalisoli]GGG23794.1 hypothetical protein GCM10007425_17790 [Lysinibacillus alkalisoli]